MGGVEHVVKSVAEMLAGHALNPFPALKEIRRVLRSGEC